MKRHTMQGYLAAAALAIGLTAHAADITGAGIVSMSAEALVGHAGPEGNELWAA